MMAAPGEEPARRLYLQHREDAGHIWISELRSDIAGFTSGAHHQSAFSAHVATREPESGLWSKAQPTPVLPKTTRLVPRGTSFREYEVYPVLKG